MPVIVNGEEYLSSSEASQLVGRTVDTIAIWCKHKRIICRRDGTGRWLIQRASLEAFINGDPTPSSGNDLDN